jgi:biotin synthase
MNSLIENFFSKVMAGGKIERDEALEMAASRDLDGLIEASDRIRERFAGKKVQLCTIMNARSGGCEENCKFCAQSSHYFTGIPEYKLVGAEEALSLAKANEADGVERFSLVTSGRALTGEEFERVLSIYNGLHANTGLKLCASLGIISYEQAVRLRVSGVFMYHHNLETSRNYFPSICDTHSYDERVETIRSVQRAGFDVCSGGIFGLGETIEDRIDMALELRSLGVRSVPVNILNPIPGTPLENRPALSPDEFFRSVAIYRFLLPSAEIRYAGGRANLGDQMAKGYRAGISAALVGNFLTTIGNRIPQDLEMIRAAGLDA